MGIHLPPGIFGGRSKWASMTIAVAFGRGRRCSALLHGPVSRPRRQRATRAAMLAKDQPETTSEGRASLGQRISTSGALTSINRVVERPRLGRQHGARAGARRPCPEADRVPRHPRRRDRRHPAGHDRAQPVHRALRQSAPAGSSASSSASGCRASGSIAARASASRHSTTTWPTRSLLLANALRAGSSFLQAIEMVVRESQPPISTEFGARHPRGQPRPAARRGAGQHGPPRPIG